MSDVTVAPSGGGAPSAAPVSSQTSQGSANPSEVVVNTNQTHIPNPVGSQAPDKPVGDLEGSKHRPPSRREALEAAFKRAETPPPKGERPAQRPPAKPAEAKAGHNQPPEETPKLDLKRRPDDQPKAAPPRAEHGHFAPRQVANQPEGNTPPNTRENTPPENQRQPIRQLPEHAPYRDPPLRMAEHGKRDWANTPESVRGEVHRVQNEFAKAYQYYKGAHDAFKPIEPFHKMAQEHGTTLEKALTNYISMEQKLRDDPIAGLDVIINNLGLKAPDGSPLGFRDIAYHVLSQSPEQLKQLQLGNTQQAAAQQIGALHAEIADLKNSVNQMHNQQRFTYSRSVVDQFAETHPRFDEREVGATVQQELQFGFDLETAYRRAELLNPATHAAQTRDPPAQTRPTDRSISGAPDVAPSNGASRRPKAPSPTNRDAVTNAIRRVQGMH